MFLNILQYYIYENIYLGGAERLVVDAAVGLQHRGHQVTVFTSYHDSQHCFSETVDGALKIKVLGQLKKPQWWPGFDLIFATIRGIFLSLQVLYLYNDKKFDIIFVDQLSVGIVLFRWFWPTSKVFFYCHYPDLLLSSRNSILKKLYRYPLDHLEKMSTLMADAIAVNSQFTKRIFIKTFLSDISQQQR